MKRSKFFTNTLMLTASNIITGTLTFTFSIILSREIGPTGMGIYQLVMPLYNMFLFITGGGITVSMSKIAAEKKASNRLGSLYKTINVLCLFEIIWSLLITGVLMLICKYISKDILADQRTYYSILAFCPALIIVSLSSLFKGAYYGLQRIIEPALIDIVEKIVRIVIMVFLVSITRNYGIEFSAASAVLSLSCGELVSLSLFYICYRIYVQKHPGYDKPDNAFQLNYEVLKLSLPLALNGILSTLFSTINTALIPKRLAVSGIPYETALGMLGKLQGMTLTMVFYPTVFIGAINTLLIPSISEAITAKKSRLVNRRINTALVITSMTGFSSAIIMFSLPAQLGQFFFKDPTLGKFLYMLTPGIPLIYIEMTSFSILNGLGKQKNLLINSTILSICELILLYTLLGIPWLNIKGYSINFIVSAVLGLILNFNLIKNTCDYSLDLYRCFLLPSLCCILLYIIIKYFLIFIPNLPLIIFSSYAIFFSIYIPIYKLSKGKN